MHERLDGSSFFEGDEEKARVKYREYCKLIRRVAPPERLLEFKLEDGWPLCEFLRRPIPEGPFQRVNDGKAFQRGIQIILCKVSRASS